MQIDGYFNTRNEPVVELQLNLMYVEMLIDTGFDGVLIIPSQIADQLKLKFQGFEEFYSVTGERIVATAYSIEIAWLGQMLRVPIVVNSKINEAILGNQMLKSCRLTIDYGHRTVTIVESPGLVHLA